MLEDAGIKLATVATDVMGLSGRAMMDALLNGSTDPAVLADLARGKLRAKLPALREALRGRFRVHHAFLLAQILAKADFLEEAIAGLTTEIMRDSVTYQELGADSLDRRDRERTIRRHVRHLESFGYKVTLEEPAA